MTKRILILGSKKNGYDYTRAKVLSNINGLTVDCVWVDEELSIHVDIERKSIIQDGSVFELNSFDLIIYWPASFQDVSRTFGAFYKKGRFRTYVARTWKILEEGLLTSFDGRMLNKYSNSLYAANKTALLRLSLDHDIPFPPTVITNDAMHAYERLGEPLIAKTLADSVELDERNSLFATFITRDQLSNVSGDNTLSSPYIFQSYIRPAYEYKAYFYDNDLVVVRFYRRDFLADMRLAESVEAELVEQSYISKLTRKLARVLDLSMFSADFLEDRSGAIYLLEVNPHGSWHWLEEAARNCLDACFVRMIGSRMFCTSRG